MHIHHAAAFVAIAGLAVVSGCGQASPFGTTSPAIPPPIPPSTSTTSPAAIPSTSPEPAPPTIGRPPTTAVGQRPTVGTIETFDSVVLAERLGIVLNEELFAPWEGDPVLIADLVETFTLDAAPTADTDLGSE